MTADMPRPHPELAQRLREHAYVWERVFERHPALDDEALIADLRAAAVLLESANAK